MEFELIVQNGILPALPNNFEKLKAKIQERLAPYRIQVTEENLAEAKKLATELGKGATQLKQKGKEEAKKYEGPIDVFNSQVMFLVGMIQEGQDFLKNQVKVFEDKTRAACLEAMTASLKGAYLSLGVRAEYQTGLPKLPEMVGISKVNSKGELTKAGKDQVFALAQTDRGIQDLVDGRIAKLEADCYKAGLKTPLSRIHVERILCEPDATYKLGLENLIAIEVDRQEKTLAGEKERMEREAREKAEKEARDKMAQEAREKKERDEKEAAEKKAAEPPPPPLPPVPVIPPPLPPIVAPCPVSSQIPAFSFPSASAPQKTAVSILVRFRIETTKTSPDQLEATRKYFQEQLSSLRLPPFSIIIEKEK